MTLHYYHQCYLRYQFYFRCTYLTAPASMKAKPHCMKNIMIDIMSKKKWSTSFGSLSASSFLLMFVCVVMLSLMVSLAPPVMVTCNGDASSKFSLVPVMKAGREDIISRGNVNLASYTLTLGIIIFSLDILPALFSPKILQNKKTVNWNYGHVSSIFSALLSMIIRVNKCCWKLL